MANPSALWVRISSLPALLAVLTAGLPLQDLLTPAASAAPAAPPRAEVRVNRALPPVAPPAATPAFSASPSDAEIGNARILELPLVPAGGATTPDENRDLAGALLAYAGSASLEDLSPLTGFLDRHPASP